MVVVVGGTGRTLAHSKGDVTGLGVTARKNLGSWRLQVLGDLASGASAPEISLLSKGASSLAKPAQEQKPSYMLPSTHLATKWALVGK